MTHTSDSDDLHSSEEPGARPRQYSNLSSFFVARNLLLLVAAAAAVALIGLSIGFGIAVGKLNSDIAFLRTQSSLETPGVSNLFENMPVGTNFGGWLVLEDWFFSGDLGNDVSTSGDKGQGVCLPPLYLGSNGTGYTWSSEGLFVQYLNNSLGPEKTKNIFGAHRNSYITQIDYIQIAGAGIKYVRLPITWAAFPDALAPLDPIYSSFNPDKEVAIVPDPYYVGVASLVTIPRDKLREILKLAAKHGLKILLDIHCMPGGSSTGTYNGVYPNPPMFWSATTKLGSPPVALSVVGEWVAKALINFVQGLDSYSQEAVLGITLMNEPAHLNLYTKPQPYVADATVLQWVANASDVFRQSALPGKGIKLYVNLIETSMKDFWTVVPDWYSKTFSRSERYSWAVMDIHWYTAWAEATCAGSLVEKLTPVYQCNQDPETIRPIYQYCASKYAEGFRKAFDGLRACSEFSAGTYHVSALACNDQDLLRMFISEQVAAFQANGVEGYFWTWAMPYGRIFNHQWSLKTIAGLDASLVSFPCDPSLGTL